MAAQRVRSALIQAINGWLNNFGAEKALVELYTGYSLAPSTVNSGLVRTLA